MQARTLDPSGAQPMIAQAVPVYGAQQNPDGTEEMSKGDQLLNSRQAFPEAREYTDLPWAVLFLLLCSAWVYNAGQGMSEISTLADDDEFRAEGIEFVTTFGHVVPKACLLGLGFGLLSSCVWCYFIKLKPVFMVWLSLLLFPVAVGASGCLMIAWGVSGMMVWLSIVGVVQMMIACCLLCCVMCWKKYVPLTAELLAVAIGIFFQKIQLALIPLFSVVMAAVLSFSVIYGVIGAFVVHEQNAKRSRSRDDMDSFLHMQCLAAVFSLMWISITLKNVSYVTACGVFGRWYFGRVLSTTASLIAATTTQFGSICFASFLVAAVRFLRYLAEQLMNSAEDDGNPVLMCIACIMMFMLACIEDIVEWFNGYAFVQVAVRGLTFCESCHATIALATRRNIKALMANELSAVVISFSSLFCFLIAAFGSNIYAGHEMPAITASQMEWNVAAAVFIFAGYGALMASSAVFSMLGAGLATLMVCWAEDPIMLSHAHPNVHNQFLLACPPAERNLEMQATGAVGAQGGEAMGADVILFA